MAVIAYASIHFSLIQAPSPNHQISRVSAVLLGLVSALFTISAVPVNYTPPALMEVPTPFFFQHPSTMFVTKSVFGVYSLLAGFIALASLCRFFWSSAAPVLLFALSYGGFGSLVFYYSRTSLQDLLISSSLGFLSGALLFAMLFPGALRALYVDYRSSTEPITMPLSMPPNSIHEDQA